MAILFGSGGRVLKGSKQIGVVRSWRIDQGGGSETDWSGGLTAVWETKPELGAVTVELTGSGRTWTGSATITDLPFRLPPDRVADIGFQGNGSLNGV